MVLFRFRFVFRFVFVGFGGPGGGFGGFLLGSRSSGSFWGFLAPPTDQIKLGKEAP